MRKAILKIEVRQLPDPEGDGDYIGIDAKATVTVGHVVQTITSGGLWDIEGDSPPDYLAEIAREQLDELRLQLGALGFASKQIDHFTTLALV